MIKLTKDEIRDLRAYGYDTEIKTTLPGQEFDSILLISGGRRPLHDSGFPFITVLGIDSSRQLYDMGNNHDHIWITNIRDNISIDSIGKTIFHLWKREKIKARYGNCSTSTINIDKDIIM